MTTRVRCHHCGVWIPIEESRPANEVDELLVVRMYPDDWRACKDLNACFRRTRDKVAASPIPSAEGLPFLPSSRS